MKTQNVKMSYGVIGRVLVGSLPLRSVDDKKEYSVLHWTPKVEV